MVLTLSAEETIRQREQQEAWRERNQNNATHIIIFIVLSPNTGIASASGMQPIAPKSVRKPVSAIACADSQRTTTLLLPICCRTRQPSKTKQTHTSNMESSSDRPATTAQGATHNWTLDAFMLPEDPAWEWRSYHRAAPSQSDNGQQGI